MNRRVSYFALGVSVVLALWAVARLAEAHTPFPSWRPAVVNPTPPQVTPAQLPRVLRTMPQPAPQDTP